MPGESLPPAGSASEGLARPSDTYAAGRFQKLTSPNSSVCSKRQATRPVRKCGSVDDQAFVGPVPGTVARAALHFLVAGCNPLGVALRRLGPAAFIPCPFRTRVMPEPAHPYVVR